MTQTDYTYDDRELQRLFAELSPKERRKAVKSALHLRTAVSADGRISMRSCVLVNAVEDWQDDAYVQQLTFEIKL